VKQVGTSFDSYRPGPQNFQHAVDYIASFDDSRQEKNAVACLGNMMQIFSNNDYMDLRETLKPNSNTLSMKIFEILTGIKLHKTQEKRMRQLEVMFQEEHAKFLKKLEEEERKRLLEEEHERKNKVYNELKDTRIRSDDGRVISRLQDFRELYCKGWRVGRKLRGAVARYIFSSPDGHAYIFIDAGVADYLQSENFTMNLDSYVY
jgi:hypothetical protein